MQSTYVAVLKECEAELQTWFEANGYKVLNRVAIAQTVILQVLAGNKSVRTPFYSFAEEQNWPFNLVFFTNETEYWPSQSVAVRFDAQGNRFESKAAIEAHSEIREVLHTLITLEPNDPRQKDRLFHAYLLKDEWDNQLQFGRLHAMRKLVGGL